MKISTDTYVRSLAIIVILCAALTIAQIWLDIMSMATFIKAITTLVILGVLAAFMIGIKKDISEERKLKDDKFID